MYCKNCGCKINIGEKRCSDCGNDIKGVEYCGGFWGLVGEEKKVKTLNPIEEKPKEEPEKKKVEKVKTFEKYIVQRKIAEGESEKLNEELMNTIMKKNKIITKYKIWKIFLIGVVLILMTGCLLQAVQISQVSKQCDELYQIYEGLSLEYQELYDYYAELKEQLVKSLNSNVEENIFLEKQEKDDLNEQNETTELLEKVEELSDKPGDLNGKDESEKILDSGNNTSEESKDLNGKDESEESLDNLDRELKQEEGEK